MKALVYDKNSKSKISLCEKENPKIINPKDAIVEVTLSSICTSDLHIINGMVPRANNNIILGHEFVGKVVEVGSDIKNLKVWDRVSANCETFCGECYFCKKGYINNCEKGGWELGCRIDGCQAQYVRVPFAEMGLTKIPDNVSDRNALFVGDILSSGYFGAEMCEIKPDDTIAVIGSGPVGMCSMICAKILGAKTIIAIDINEKRLNIAKENNLANYYLNPKTCDIEKEIKAITQNKGADGVIEAAGFSNYNNTQANHNFTPSKPYDCKNDSTLELAWKIARPNAIIGVVAMYEENQVLPLPLMYGKNLTFKTGGVDAIHCKKLLKLISEGKINTDFLITQTFKLENILNAYELFKTQKDNCLKIAIEE